jgi:hypothetical protein
VRTGKDLSNIPSPGPSSPVQTVTLGSYLCRASCAKQMPPISKQGNALLRFLLVEATQMTVRSDQHWRSQFFHLAMRHGRKIAKVAMARKLTVELSRCGVEDVALRMGLRTRCNNSVRTREKVCCDDRHRSGERNRALRQTCLTLVNGVVF